MSSTLLPMIMEVMLVQWSKAFFPMLVTLLGMVMEVRLEHPEKAYSSTLITLLGIIIDVMLVQLEKALFPIVDTVLGMVVFLQPTNNVLVFVKIIALQVLRESYMGFPSSISIILKFSQP